MRSDDAPLIIFLLERLHVLSNVSTEDVLLQDLCVKLLAFWVVARETLLVVWDVKTTIGSTFEGTEHTRTSRRALETDIEVTLERPGGILIIEGLGQNEGTIGLSLSFVLVGKTKLGQGATSAEKASCVGCIKHLELEVAHAS